MRHPRILITLFGSCFVGLVSARLASGQAIPPAADDSAALYQRSALPTATAATRIQSGFRLAPDAAALILIRAGYPVAEAAGGGRLTSAQQALLAVGLHSSAEREKDRVRRDNEQKQHLRELITMLLNASGSLEAVADLLVNQARATTDQALAILLTVAPSPREFARAATRARASGKAMFTVVMTIPGTSLTVAGEALEEAGQTASQIFGAAMAAGKTLWEAMIAFQAALQELSQNQASLKVEVQAVYEMLKVSNAEVSAATQVMMTHFTQAQQRAAIANAALQAAVHPDGVVGGIQGAVGTLGGTVSIMASGSWPLKSIATGFEGNATSAQNFATGWAGMPGRTKSALEAADLAFALAQSDYAVANVTAMFTLLKTAGFGATAVAAAVSTALAASAQAIASGLMGAGYSVSATTEALKVGIGATSTAAVSALVAAGVTASAIAVALRDIYQLGFLEVAKRLKEVQFDFSEIFQGLTTAFALTSAQTAEVVTLLRS
ncbi:MAG: hypothetical protein ACKVZ0_13985 [Gemmatimonadales bacterium]